MKRFSLKVGRGDIDTNEVVLCYGNRERVFVPEESKKIYLIPVTLGGYDINKECKDVTVLTIKDAEEITKCKRFVLWEKEASDHALRLMGRLIEKYDEGDQNE